MHSSGDFVVGARGRHDLAARVHGSLTRGERVSNHAAANRARRASVARPSASACDAHAACCRKCVSHQQTGAHHGCDLSAATQQLPSDGSSTMTRRDLIDAMTLATVSIALPSGALAGPPAAPAVHDHGAMASAHADLIAATTRCISASEACLAHCIRMLSEGDRTLAACTATVRDTIAACTALRQLAAADSVHVAALAEVGASVCSDCERECARHERHAVCKECGDACSKCAQACRAVAT